ncbi:MULTISPECIES: ATP-binding protein [Streptomyces]|uniref:ATP-binding protein n=1 Tax=Streptomyces cacaoi TaxID=1898 RepID=A0A4Y3QQS3_STRCI|nr:MULTISPECIES: ATP-binding protein [Streptomyces]GEB47635.1 ATP-binding protein [Streptomyces cacaoi]
MAPSYSPAPLALPQPAGSGASAGPVRREGFELPAHTSSVSRARSRLSGQLRRWGFPEELGHTALLVISEFVTNAVLHTDSGRIGCNIQLDGQRLRIEVTDEGTERCVPRARSAAPEEVGGRGLQLVGALTERWGVSAGDTPCGRKVWAELGTC